MKCVGKVGAALQDSIEKTVNFELQCIIFHLHATGANALVITSHQDVHIPHIGLYALSGSAIFPPLCKFL